MSTQIKTIEAADRRKPAWLGALLFVVAFAVGNYLLPLGKMEVHWWADLAWTVAALLTAWRCFLVARKLRDHEVKAWRFLGWGCLAWFMGILYWDYGELLAGQVTPFPEISDIGFLLFAPLCAAGLLYYHREVPNAPFTIMEFSQLGIFIACVFAAHIIVFYGPISNPELSVLYRATALAYPVLYMALLVQAISTLWMHVDDVARRPLILVVIGLSAHAVTNSFYAYSLLGQSYEAGNYMDIGWILGFAFIYSGAEQRRTTARLGAVAAEKGHSKTRPLLPGGLIPPAALLATLMVVVIFHDQIQPGMIDLLLPVVFLLVVFLTLREWAGAVLTRRLDAAERAAEEKLRSLAHIVPVGILRIDLGGDCYYANEYCGEITGVPPYGHLGRGWVQSLHPDDRERVEREWRQVMVGGGTRSLEYRFLRPDGRVVWVTGQATAERDNAGEIVGYIGSITDITARRDSEEALRESEQRFRRVFSAMPVMASISHLADDRFLNINDTFLSVTGYVREEVIGRATHELGLWVAPDSRESLLRRLHQEGRITGVDWKMRIKSGQTRDIFGSFEVVQLGHEACLLVIGQDVTERRLAEARAKKLSSALEQTADAVMITDRHGVIEYVNHAFTVTTGYAVEEVLGAQPKILNSGKQGPEFYRELWETILSGNAYSEVFVNKKKDGSLYYEAKTITPLKDGDGAITHFVSTGNDITERMETQERMQYLAHHDVLTGLPNRALFHDRLKQSLAYARWHNRLVAVLFFDIDRFKNINDTLGHEVGDLLLQEISRRLPECLRERDTVARFGGDEFVIVLNDIATAADVGVLAKTVLEIMRPSFLVNEVTLHLTASIGISLFPGDGEDATSLLRKADTAMYRAKDMGRNNYQFYSVEMGVRAFERLAMENKLRQALERDEFVLHYQPQIDVRSGRIIGVEALLRWQHPEIGMVPPLEFIPMLEETGLIMPVGEWVLHTACRQLGLWHKSGWDHLRMAVNLSGRQFNSDSLIPFLTGILTGTRLSADRLELEITESVLMRRDGATAKMLRAISEMGVSLGLDDFGTGYSSLNYLRRFPINTLKIDRSFIRDIPADAEATTLTETIIAMGKALKLELIAEGVETRVQADFLQSVDCHIMQGFLFSRPVSAAELTKLLTAPPRLRVI